MTDIILNLIFIPILLVYGVVINFIMHKIFIGAELRVGLSQGGGRSLIDPFFSMARVFSKDDNRGFFGYLFNSRVVELSLNITIFILFYFQIGLDGGFFHSFDLKYLLVLMLVSSLVSGICKKNDINGYSKHASLSGLSNVIVAFIPCFFVAVMLKLNLVNTTLNYLASMQKEGFFHWNVLANPVIFFTAIIFFITGGVFYCGLFLDTTNSLCGESKHLPPFDEWILKVNNNVKKIFFCSLIVAIYLGPSVYYFKENSDAFYIGKCIVGNFIFLIKVSVVLFLYKFLEKIFPHISYAQLEFIGLRVCFIFLLGLMLLSPLLVSVLK